jgi:predicted phage baseplate assembly protein
VSGEIQFGSHIRQPDGTEKHFGKIPPKGSQIRFSAYRCGGGVHGNIGERTLTVLKSSIPYVAWVTNFSPVLGGTDSESLENAKLRAPQLLQARTRAVTAEDFELLAREASSAVARAKCLTPGENGGTIPPGTVQLLIVPAVYKTDAPIPKEQLVLPDRIRREVEHYLDERRLIGTHLIIGAPDYRWVSVEARIKAKAGSDPVRIKSEVEKSLYSFINPICGGSDKAGWPFGRALFLSELYSVFQEVKGIDYVEEVKLYPVDPETDQQGEASTKISVSAESLVCSYKHQITVI